MTEFNSTMISAEDAFWVMFHFLDNHYRLSNGQFDLSDVLSASQPFGFDEKGHFDGKAIGNRLVRPADGKMIKDWNAALEKYLIEGRPGPKALK